jgi:hypothetical protein
MWKEGNVTISNKEYWILRTVAAVCTIGMILALVLWGEHVSFCLTHHIIWGKNG